MHLAEDCTSLEMKRLMTRTDQLVCNAKATGSKIYTKESEAETHSLTKALVFLKQPHIHFCRLYEEGTTRAMVGLQGLHSSDASQHSNILASMGLNSFCLWCFKFGGNTEMIATHLREVHYSLAIVCDICQAFASMSMQVDLEHQSRCRTKLHKKSKMQKQDEPS